MQSANHKQTNESESADADGPNVTLNFSKYRLSWRFTDKGVLCESIFWLPRGADPHDYVSDILNIVELSAGEYGHEYSLVKEEL